MRLGQQLQQEVRQKREGLAQRLWRGAEQDGRIATFPYNGEERRIALVTKEDVVTAALTADEDKAQRQAEAVISMQGMNCLEETSTGFWEAAYLMADAVPPGHRAPIAAHETAELNARGTAQLGWHYGIPVYDERHLHGEGCKAEIEAVESGESSSMAEYFQLTRTLEDMQYTESYFAWANAAREDRGKHWMDRAIPGLFDLVKDETPRNQALHFKDSLDADLHEVPMVDYGDVKVVKTRPDSYSLIDKSYEEQGSIPSSFIDEDELRAAFKRVSPEQTRFVISLYEDLSRTVPGFHDEASLQPYADWLRDGKKHRAARRVENEI